MQIGELGGSRFGGWGRIDSGKDGELCVPKSKVHSAAAPAGEQGEFCRRC